MAAIRQCALVLVLAAGVGCASQKGSSSSSSRAGPARWTGAFKPEGGSAVIGSELTRARSTGYGTITLTPVSDQQGRVKVDMSVTTSVVSAQVAWALFEGPCGAPTPPVIAVNQFPTIEVGNNGSGLVRAELPMTLDTRATYHANVYWTGRATDVTNVMLCAKVAFSGN